MLGQGTEGSLFVDVAFWMLAISSIVAAVAVVQMQNLFRAALFLIVSFLAIAGMFVLLRAEFIAAVQVLIYVGAISVLIIFAILMTGEVERGSVAHTMRIPVAVLAALFGVAAIFVAVNTNWLILDTVLQDGNLSAATTNQVENVFSNTIPWIGRLLVQDFVLAFEVASLVLLAAIIGALALIRER
ncbi:MAG: NADH-quinone oxidoreductase subunit J [Dehalococcoidia bacterium]|nr:NADH-quinone oxidoreductase subunit J [Dehalococcoidia bacterium]